MKFLKYIYTTLILLATLFTLGSCSSSDDNLSKAVLPSARTLSFEGTKAVGQIITVYADADWVAEVPEWITVNPVSGSGQTDVTISVVDNIRDGALDNPRKAVVAFKGATLASRSEVLVIQGGDKFRDVKEYTVGDLAALKDEAIVSVPNITVMAVTTTGFIATDEAKTSTIYVKYSETVNIGDKVSIMGDKFTDAQALPFVSADILEVVSTGGTVTYPTAKNITKEVDTYNADTRVYIEVSGVLTGNNIKIKNATTTVNIVDAPSSLNLKDLNGHRITVKGYFGGIAKPVLRIMTTEIQDNGIGKIIYFSEDFEWLDPWSAISSAGQTVETDNMSAKAPQIIAPVVDGVTALQALEDKGYGFLRVWAPSKGEDECIYLQRNYIKFGKTSYQAGIVLPKIVNVPEDVEPVMSFKWSPMRQGSGVIDPVNLIIAVENEGQEVTFDVPESGFVAGQKLEWIEVEIPLVGVKITRDTKVTIRQTQWGVATANRWMLDDIEIAEVD